MRGVSTRIRAHVGVCLLLITVAVGAAQSTYPELRPVDEAAQQPAFFTFRAHLQAAIARHDAAAILAVVHPNIKNNFGGDDGRDAFERIWKLDSPDSELWETLGTVLALGGTFDADGMTFVAPYTFSRWPQNVEGFEHVAVVGSRVRVRAAPSADAATLASLSFSILPIARDARPRSDELDRQWTAVRLGAARVGYVASRYVRSPVDHRAFFARTGDTWRLLMFLAGD